MRPALYPLLIGLGFAAFGVLFVVIGVRTGRATRRFRARAQRTTGTCVDLVYRSSSSNLVDSTNTGGWAPVMAFRTLDGRDVQATSRFWSSPAPVRRGRQAPVLYDPADPTDFRVDNLRGSGGCIGPAFVGIGSVFALVGLVVAAVGVVLVRSG